MDIAGPGTRQRSREPGGGQHDRSNRCRVDTSRGMGSSDWGPGTGARAFHYAPSTHEHTLAVETQALTLLSKCLVPDAAGHTGSPGRMEGRRAPPQKNEAVL